MNETYRSEIREKIRYRPRLIPIFGSTHNLPERVYEYHPRLFLCYNTVENRYELHSLDQEFSYCASLPYRSLDARTMRWIWENDIRTHGKALMRRLDQAEEDRLKSKDRERKNWIEDVAKETQSLLAKDAWALAT